MLRNHPSLFLWCGGNETYPPKDILEALQQDIFPKMDPKRFFLDQSLSPKLMMNERGGTGDGPYGILEPVDMFTKRSFPFNPEIGSIGIPNFDGLKKIIPTEEMRGSKFSKRHRIMGLPQIPFFARFPRSLWKSKGRGKIIAGKPRSSAMSSIARCRRRSIIKCGTGTLGCLVWKNQESVDCLTGFMFTIITSIIRGAISGINMGRRPCNIQLNLNDSTVCVVKSDDQHNR